MDDAQALRFPDSKTLASWWRQLQPLHPRILWLGYAYLHRIEIPVKAPVAVPLDHLTRLLLETLRLANSRTTRSWPAFPAGVLDQLLHSLGEFGVVRRLDRQWQLTQAGHEALTRGSLQHPRIERRRLALAERVDAGGSRRGPPVQVPIAEGGGEPWEIPMKLRLDLAQVRGTLASSDEIAELPTRDWQSVIVDHGERHRLALVQTATQVCGYAFSTDPWRLHSQTAVLNLEVPAEELWPDCSLPSTADLQSAWASWHLAALSAPAPPARLHLREDVVEVELSEPSSAVLQALADGEAWVLVGGGHFRRACKLHARI